MKYYLFLQLVLLWIFIFVSGSVSCVASSAAWNVVSDGNRFVTPNASTCLASEGVRVVFYNVENLFDCDDDSLTVDEEYLPSGIRGWTPSRFWRKIGQIARVLAVIGSEPTQYSVACNTSVTDDISVTGNASIAAITGIKVGDGSKDNKPAILRVGFPPIVGLAEIENAACLRRLTKSSPLKNAGYDFIHFDSPDIRGIDVCLLYNPYVFSPLVSRPLTVTFPNEPKKKTRDVLYVCGKVNGRDTLHLFVCHFPSRLGGEPETDPYRCLVASIIKAVTDSILSQSASANILIMGDFNDHPDSPSLKKVLEAGTPVIPAKVSVSTNSAKIRGIENDHLYNLMWSFHDTPDFGTYKHQSVWGILDQLIVSGALLNKASAYIFKPPFLLIQDDRWLGLKPFRTYHGMTYQGGYSDHLPVFVDLRFQERQ